MKHKIGRHAGTSGFHRGPNTYKRPKKKKEESQVSQASLSDF